MVATLPGRTQGLGLTFRETNIRLIASEPAPRCFEFSAHAGFPVRIGRVSLRRVSDVTQLLNAVAQGDPKATDALIPLVYEELRRLARYRMSVEPAGHTLQPTALVHEAWMRLTNGNSLAPFGDRRHFFGAAAEAMRRILVESARRKKCVRHGGKLQRAAFEGVELSMPMPDDELLATHEALDKLATVDARAAEVVKLCFFVGLTQAQTAHEMGISLSTAERLWSFARAWLFREIKKMRGDAPDGRI
jgi:RNA polymerase sigma factor (TIGR02999 family)